MYKINITNLPAKYVEVRQNNPIRWMVLKHNDDGTLTNTSMWFKCRDYFNDFACFFQEKKPFSIYGMTQNQAAFTPNGEMLLLVNNTLKGFDNNLEKLNIHLESQFGITVKNVKDDPVEIEQDDILPKLVDPRLLVFPKECFTSTYRISLITILIRVSNTDNKYEHLSDLLKQDWGKKHQECDIQIEYLDFLRKGKYKLKNEPVVATMYDSVGDRHNNGWIGYLATLLYKSKKSDLSTLVAE